jgi:dTMP kinase
VTAAARHVRGRFITLEGVEGVGKSTNLAFVAGYLRNAGKSVVVTREPGGVPIAECIRDVLLATDGEPLPAITELLLMFAARAAHLAELIRPELDRGHWVVCDRFTDASYAYQGSGRGLPSSIIEQLEALVQGHLRPDLTLLLDADWDVTRGRRDSRGVRDRFELEDRAFFERVRAGYLARARLDPGRIKLIDANRPLAGVQSEIVAALAGLLPVASLQRIRT